MYTMLHVYAVPVLTTSKLVSDELRDIPAGKQNLAAVPVPSVDPHAPPKPATVETALLERSMERKSWPPFSDLAGQGTETR